MKDNSFHLLLLLLIPVLLKGILPDPYLNHFNHLSKGIYLLSQSKLSTTDIRTGEKSLCKFLKGGKRLYGDAFFSFNVHQVSHLASTASNWGPLWVTSAFQFESYNGKMVDFVKSSNGVILQVTNKITDFIQLQGFNDFNSTPKALK